MREWLTSLVHVIDCRLNGRDQAAFRTGMDKRYAKLEKLDNRAWKRAKGEMLVWSFDASEIGKRPLHAYSDYVRGIKGEADLFAAIDPKLHGIVKWYVDAFIVDMGAEPLLNHLAGKYPNQAMDALFFALDIEIRKCGI